MSRRREVDHQLLQLQELQDIIGSMKTLSQIELHKLGGMAETQQQLTGFLRQTASDFLYFFPQREPDPEPALWLVLGSERGFCGDFNDALIRRLLQEAPGCAGHPGRVLAVGRKLWGRLDEQLPGYVPLMGASVSEELSSVLSQIVVATHGQLAEQGAATLHLLYHGGERGEIQTQRLLPPEHNALPSSRNAPMLQLSAETFFSEFLQHYLSLSLTGIFTSSLLAENQQRVQHLESAVRRLDDRLAELANRSRTLRQEEITEEIEMILLGTGVFSPVGR